MSKPFKTGLIIGNFYVVHKGHEYLIETGLKLCDRVLILVTDPENQNTPFPMETRIAMLRMIYKDNPCVIIRSIADIHNPNKCIYWEHNESCLKTSRNTTIYKAPEVKLFSHKDSKLLWQLACSNTYPWFDFQELKNAHCFSINPNVVPISKFDIYLALNDFQTWSELVNPKLYSMYDSLRQKLVETT